MGTSQPPRAQESSTQSPPWVTLSFVQQRRQRGEQGAPSQEPVNKSWGGLAQRPGEGSVSEARSGRVPSPHCEIPSEESVVAWGAGMTRR